MIRALALASLLAGAVPMASTPTTLAAQPPVPAPPVGVPTPLPVPVPPTADTVLQPPAPPSPPPARKGTPSQPPSPPTAPSPPAPPASSPPPSEPARPRRLVNVFVELTISDQLGSAAPDKRTVSLTVADGMVGRVRAAASARPNEQVGTVVARLDVDARPVLHPNGPIELYLGLTYQPLRSMQGSESIQTTPTELNQTITVLLQDGKPTVVSQATDPITERRTTVEVKATIQK